MIYTALMVVQVISAIAIVALILLQQGKGADAGASFGGGASQTFFGSAGSGNFLTHSTAVLTAVFFATSLGLAYYAKQQSEGGFEISLPDSSTDLPSMGLPDSELSTEAELPAVEPTSQDKAASDVETKVKTAVLPEGDLEAPPAETAEEVKASVEAQAKESAGE